MDPSVEKIINRGNYAIKGNIFFNILRWTLSLFNLGIKKGYYLELLGLELNILWVFDVKKPQRLKNQINLREVNQSSARSEQIDFSLFEFYQFITEIEVEQLVIIFKSIFKFHLKFLC
ncbi:hypothetical protein BpHYR1_020573 [Brachionus plicatilis]|uniref:Uncharacterized protein n=1 Tax=Brachionus plicatilis TaxID=10195 RepID=A0A3M7QHL7_BRAPC|nr:hypothetical protein BpHYR1_020573 [Brachionus plicatilis]